MPRSLRLEFPGAFYHVMARGNRRETIFHDDDDRRFFLATLGDGEWGQCANLDKITRLHTLPSCPEAFVLNFPVPFTT
jgi:hypothetical protein